MDEANVFDELVSPGTENAEDLISVAEEVLYQQKLGCKIENVRGKVSKFKAKISSLISCAEDVDDFIKTYNEHKGE